MSRNEEIKGEKVTLPMQNHGNTCFFNATMQCLTHTVPFFQLSLSDYHSSQCSSRKIKRFCFQCEYSKFARTVKEQRRTDPLPIVRSLQQVWHGFRLGQQKDAHEFLTIYLEALLNSSFAEKPSRVHVIKNQSQTPLFQLFGGKLRSQIKCQRCNYTSDTFDETFTLPL